MKKIKYIIYIWLTCFLSYNIYSQPSAQGNYTNIVPANPNTTAVANLATSGADLSSGALTVNIPIYTFSEREINVPLSLNYTGNGIKVNDIGSNVGLGWAMSGQWMITRNIMHKDDTGGLGYATHDLDPSTFGATVLDHLTERFDFQPDEYSFTFGGNSGKFSIKKDGTLFHKEKTDLKFTRVPTGWEVLDGNGHRYIFDVEEESHTDSDTGGSTSVEGGITAWYISKIILNYGYTIDFEYETNPIAYVSQNGAIFRKTYNCNNTSCSASPPPPTEILNTTTSAFSENIRLKRIVGNYTTVEFDYSSRNDVGVKLDKVSIFNDNLLNKYFDFTYDYYSNNRLKLKEFQEFGYEGSSKPPYKFMYLDELTGGKQPPHRLSNAQDHWGYYNGKDNNPTLLPYMEDDPDTYNLPTVFGNREPSSTHADAGLMYRMETPYGGFKEYDYELHDYNYLNNNHTPVVNYSIQTALFDECVRCQNCMQNQNGTNAIPLTIDFDQYINIKYFLYNTNPPQLDVGVMNIEDASGNIFYEFLTTSNAGDNEFLFFPAGTYTVNMNPTIFDACHNINFVYEEYERDQNGNPIQEPFLAGGVRIKKIADEDGVVNFLYRDDNESISSGILTSIPHYTSNYLQVFNSCPPPFLGGFECQIKEIFASSITSNILTNGSHIYYKKVTKLYEEHGSTDYYFSFLPDQINNTFPLGPNTSYEFGRGLLVEQIDKNEDGAIVKRIKNTYSFRETGISEKDELNGFKFTFYPVSPVNFPAPYRIRWYILKSRWTTLDSSTEQIWGTDGSGPFTSTTTNTYHEHNRQLASSTVSSGSDSKTTVYQYAQDLGLTGFVDKNIISYPLRTLINGGQGGGSRIDLNNYTTLPKKIFSAKNDGTWRLETFFKQYDSSFYPTRVGVRANNFKDDIYTWANGLVIKKKFELRETNFSYDAHRRFISVIDFNNITSTTIYDDLNRLINRTSNNNEVNVDFSYVYGTLSNPITRMSETTSYPGDPFGTTSLTVDNDFDSFGRKVKETRRAYTFDGSDFVLNWTYDQMGNVLTDCSPGKGGCDIKEYEHSPLSRLVKETLAGALKPRLLVHSARANLINTKVTDEDGRVNTNSTDVFGRNIESTMSTATTSFKYNTRDQVLEIQPPLGSKYLYTYNSIGQLHSKSIPDYGTTTYQYLANNALKSENKPTGEELAYTYNINYPAFLETVKLDGSIIKSYTMDGVSGWIKDEEIAYFDGNANIAGERNFTYQRDNLGRVERETKTYINASSTFNYTYDFAGNVRNLDRQHNGPSGNIVTSMQYDFQKGFRATGTTGTFPDVGSVNINNLEYNNNDWLIKKILPFQEIDYGYNARGFLNRINDITEQECCDLDPVEIECIGPFISIDVLFDCLAMESGEGTNISLNVLQYDANGNPIAFTYNIPVNGGSTNGVGGLTNTQNITVNSKTNRQTLIQGILDILLDCTTNSDGVPESVFDALQTFTVTLGGSKPIVGDLFGMKLHYENGNTDLEAPGQCAGNISWIEWQSKTEALQKYGFTYDDFSRLTKAKYKAIDPCMENDDADYDVNITYNDVMGNISAIIRNGLQQTVDENNIFGSIDNLSFSHSGNKVTGVTESSLQDKGYKGTGGAISYDAVGRMTAHSGKFTDITYNFLDLPSKIVRSQGNIEYFYDADGVKLESRSTTSGALVTKTYQDGIEYENESLTQIHHEEGRIVFDDEDATFAEFSIKDHLGNTRIRYGDKDDDGVLIYSPYNDEGNEIFGSNHYFPFGMETEGPWMKQSGLYNAYRYNGKELVDSIGLYDYGARYYDPSVGRFTGVDPLAEQMPKWSPYTYTFNNPIKYTDPDGRAPDNIVVPDKKDRAKILSMINQKASGNFEFDGSGCLTLCSNNSNSEFGSDYYTEQLVAAINAPETISISINQTFKGKGGVTKDVDKDAGGGVTISKSKKGGNQKVVISGNQNYKLKDTNGKPLVDTAADILAHELVGHAIPHIVGSDTGNAVKNENKVRSQIKTYSSGVKLPSPLRAAEKKHIE